MTNTSKIPLSLAKTLPRSFLLGSHVPNRGERVRFQILKKGKRREKEREKEEARRFKVFSKVQAWFLEDFEVIS